MDENLVFWLFWAIMILVTAGFFYGTKKLYSRSWTGTFHGTPKVIEYLEEKKQIILYSELSSIEAKTYTIIEFLKLMTTDGSKKFDIYLNRVISGRGNKEATVTIDFLKGLVFRFKVRSVADGQVVFEVRRVKGSKKILIDPKKIITKNPKDIKKMVEEDNKRRLDKGQSNVLMLVKIYGENRILRKYNKEIADEITKVTNKTFSKVGRKVVITKSSKGQGIFVYAPNVKDENKFRANVEKEMSKTIRVSGIQFTISYQVTAIQLTAKGIHQGEKRLNFLQHKLKRFNQSFDWYDIDLYAEDYKKHIDKATNVAHLVKGKKIGRDYEQVVDITNATITNYIIRMNTSSEVFEGLKEIYWYVRNNGEIKQFEKNYIDSAIKDVHNGDLPSEYNYHIAASTDWVSRTDNFKMSGALVNSVYLSLIDWRETDRDKVRQAIRNLKKDGVKYGLLRVKSYENLIEAINYEPQWVQISKTIAHKVCEDTDTRIEVESMIKFANSRGVKVIFAGVDSQEILETLLLCGVVYAKGKYISKVADTYEPITTEAVEAIKKANEYVF